VGRRACPRQIAATCDCRERRPVPLFPLRRPAEKKQHLAGLRKFFNLLVERHVVVINPAAVAQTERLHMSEGATPIITDKQVRQLLASIKTDTVVGLRDRAIFGILL
jgi:integrase/recombinase XerD